MDGLLGGFGKTVLKYCKQIALYIVILQFVLYLKTKLKVI